MLIAIVGSALCDAAYSGDVLEVIRLINSGADVNGYSSSGHTPLMCALMGWKRGYHVRLGPFIIKANPPVKGDPWKVVVLRLLESGADPNLKSREEEYECPLHMAVRVGLEATKILLDHGADPNCTDYLGQNPLYEATRSDDPRVFDLLLRRGAKVQADTIGATPAMYIAFYCNRRLFDFLSDNYPRLIDWGVSDKEGVTPAILAAWKCKRDPYLALEMAYLGKKNIRNTVGPGLNFYHIMVIYSDTGVDYVEAGIMEVADFLVKSGFGDIVEAETDCGANALHFAALFGKPHLYAFLKDLYDHRPRDRPAILEKCFGKGWPSRPYTAAELFKLRFRKLPNLGL